LSHKKRKVIHKSTDLTAEKPGSPIVAKDEVKGVEEAPVAADEEESAPTQPKAKGSRAHKTVTFPTEGKINKYGFLHFSKNLRHTLGLPEFEDVPVVFQKDAKGRLYINISKKENAQ